MAEEMSVPDDLTFKRKRADAEESQVQTKRPRRESLEGEHGTTSISTREDHSETRSSAEKSYYESLRPITENPPNKESRQDDKLLEGVVLACPSSSKHYKPDKDGSSPENSKATFVLVEIPVNPDNTGLRDESNSVENDLFVNHRRGSSLGNSEQEYVTIEIQVNRDYTGLQDESNSVENEVILNDRKEPSPENSKQDFVPAEVQVNRDDTGLGDGKDYLEDNLYLNQGRDNTSILYSRDTRVDDRGRSVNILEISGIKSEVNVQQLEEATTSNDNTDLEIPGTSTQLNNDEIEGEQDEYIYRMLRFEEDYTMGLYPKMHLPISV